MKKIMSIIEKETKGKSFHTYKYSFDSIGLPAIDYDDTDKIVKWQTQGETISYKKTIPLIELADKIKETESIIKYFLDGSRHVYKVDDIAYGRNIFPVVAGQIGIGCCKRENKKMTCEEFERKLVIALPKNANADGHNDQAYFNSKLLKINDSEVLKRLNLSFSKIIPYKISKMEKDAKLENYAISVIQDMMIESEKEMVAKLVKDNKLNQNNYLLKDGSLEYKIMNSGKEDLRSLQKIRNNYRWVIGVSKSFNPESCLDHTGRPNSNYIAELPLFHRTPVARYTNSYMGDVEFAVWYVRIRDKKNTLTPFDGVLKIEKILMEDELDEGIDSDVVDLITANIINERTPTCYGSDRRWANHLYPVYLTELFVKSKYLSTELFLNLF